MRSARTPPTPADFFFLAKWISPSSFPCSARRPAVPQQHRPTRPSLQHTHTHSLTHSAAGKPGPLGRLGGLNNPGVAHQSAATAALSEPATRAAHGLSPPTKTLGPAWSRAASSALWGGNARCPVHLTPLRALPARPPCFCGQRTRVCSKSPSVAPCALWADCARVARAGRRARARWNVLLRQRQKVCGTAIAPE